MKMKFFEDSRAVSPVIGVMLMLVVTVIIAAVVSAFSAGLTDTTADTPVAAFDFKVYSTYHPSTTDEKTNAGYIEATMKSGEPIDTADLKIVSIHEDEDGNTIMKEFEKSVESVGAFGTLNVFRSMHDGSAECFGVVGTYWHTGQKFTGGAESVLNVAYPNVGDKIGIDMVYKPTNTIIWSDEVTVI
jgi:FlaG/FlaF family flagellin (archaellin)